MFWAQGFTEVFWCGLTQACAAYTPAMKDLSHPTPSQDVAHGMCVLQLICVYYSMLYMILSLKIVLTEF